MNEKIVEKLKSKKVWTALVGLLVAAGIISKAAGVDLQEAVGSFIDFINVLSTD